MPVIILTLMLLLFSLPGLTQTCPATPAYFTKDVCTDVIQSETSYKMAVVRINLRKNANSAKIPYVENEYCHLIDSYKVCGSPFVVKHLAPDIFGGHDKKMIKVLLTKSKSSLNKNAPYIKEILDRKSFSAEDDDLKLYLISQDFVSDQIDPLKLVASFDDPAKVPTNFQAVAKKNDSLGSESNEIYGPLADVDVQKWKNAYKQFPKLLEDARKFIKYSSPEDQAYKSLRLDMIVVGEDEIPGLQMNYLNKTIKDYQDGKAWNSADTGRFKQMFELQKSVTNDEKILMLENLVANKRPVFPEDTFWTVFNSLDESTFTPEQKHKLMKILFSVDNKAWAKQALGKLQTLGTYVVDQMEIPCEIDSNSLKAYFSDSYKIYKDKKQIEVIQFKEEMTFKQAQEVVDSEIFSPTVAINSKRFLDIFATSKFPKMTVEEKQTLFRSACAKGNCPSLIRVENNGPLFQAVQSQNPDALRIMLNFSKEKHHGYFNDDKKTLKGANRKSGKSEEINKV